MLRFPIPRFTANVNIVSPTYEENMIKVVQLPLIMYPPCLSREFSSAMGKISSSIPSICVS